MTRLLPSFVFVLAVFAVSSTTVDAADVPARRSGFGLKRAPDQSAEKEPERAAPGEAGPGEPMKVVDTGEFKVKLPGEPQVVRNKVTLPAGEVHTAAWTTTADGAVFSISTARYPEKVVAARPADAFLNEGRDGLNLQLNGTIVGETAVTLAGGYPGKAYSVDSDNGRVDARHYLVGPTLYTLLVLYDPSIGAPGAKEFLGSLELKNPPPPIERRPATK